MYIREFERLALDIYQYHASKTDDKNLMNSMTLLILILRCNCEVQTNYSSPTTLLNSPPFAPLAKPSLLAA
jgi:hypothetical protein